jgi:hypothetical protein
MVQAGALDTTYIDYCVWLVQDCDDLVEVQVAARVERMLEVELAAARQEAAAKYVHPHFHIADERRWTWPKITLAWEGAGDGRGQQHCSTSCRQ